MSAQSPSASAHAAPSSFAVDLSSELIIDILPRGYVAWIGTRAQLEAEGVIPAAFDWPQGREMKSWEADRFTFDIFRTKPRGVKGGKRAWAECDYWYVRRVLTAQRYDGWAAAHIYIKEQELAAVRMRQTPAGQVEWGRYFAAQQDACFSAFKASIPGVVPSRRGRPGKRGSHANGGQNAA